MLFNKKPLDNSPTQINSNRKLKKRALVSLVSTVQSTPQQQQRELMRTYKSMVSTPPMIRKTQSLYNNYKHHKPQAAFSD